MTRKLKKKNKPIAKTKKPLRFSYWEDWALIDRENGKCMFRIPKENENEIRKLRKQVFEQGKVEAIPELIKVDPNSIKEPRVSMWISRFSQMAHCDKKAKNIYEKIEKAMHGDLRGRTNPDELNLVINRDLKDFKEMINQRLEEGSTVQNLITNPVTLDFDPNKNLIWNNYIKTARQMLKGIKGSEDSKQDWKKVFRYFKVMGENFDHPSFIGYYQRWMLVKGTSW